MVARRVLALIEDCQQWPLYPFLPLAHKRDRLNGLPKPGLLVAVEGQETTVYLGLVGFTTVEETMQLPKVVYLTLEALQNDWRVD